MAITIEELDRRYKGREEDRDYLELQARLRTEAEAAEAYDADGNFHCIGFDCQHCPDFDASHCL